MTISRNYLILMNNNMNIEQLLKTANETQRDQLSEIISNFLANANEQETAEMGQILSNINVQNRNEDKTKNFAKKIMEKENEKKNRYVKFVESKSVNGIIYAGTQVGKTASTIALIKTFFQYNTPVIVSSDNKTDQQEQIKDRIEKDFISEDITLLKVTDKTFKKDLKECISNGNKRFVIFCLDNNSQIEKLIEQLTSCYTRIPKMKEIEKMAIIHDEADTIAKDQNTDVIDETQAKSHQKWLELKDTINNNMGEIDLKRIFVTSTPENVVQLYDIKCPDVMRLEKPSNYTGYDKIKHIDITDDLEIGEKLKNEVDRIKNSGTNEAILYCIDRKIEDGHVVLLQHFANWLNCIVNTYNGNGISTIINNPIQLERFERRLNRYNVSFIKNDTHFQMKNMSIRMFYSIMKDMGENCVLTIGKDLICRGISYVGSDKEAPITATVMFYRPGKTINAVNINQTIGRITGCAMPGLQRKLYCPKNVFESYINFNKNQEIYIKEITKEGNMTTTKETVDGLIFKSYKHPIDRPKLNLQMNMESDEETEVGTDVDMNLEKMIRLIDSWKNVNNLTEIAKVFRRMLDNEGKLESNLVKEMIGDAPMSSMTLIHHSKWNLVFRKENGFHYLRNEVLEYLE